MRYIKYIFVYLFASYFLMAGAGYNVVSYCCQLCAEEGIEAVATNSCSNVHKHTHNKQKTTQQDDLTCTDLSHHSENCHLLRVNTDVPSFHAQSLLKFHQIQLVDLFIPHFISRTEKTEFFAQNDIPPSEMAVNKSGRAILTFHAVLLI